MRYMNRTVLLKSIDSRGAPPKQPGLQYAHMHHTTAAERLDARPISTVSAATLADQHPTKRQMLEAIADVERAKAELLKVKQAKAGVRGIDGVET